MNIGDVIKVYREARPSHVEVCSHGHKHRVPVYQVKFITVVNIRQEFIPALNYTSDGVGNVYYAEDAQGRTYRKTDHWDGPRATLWVVPTPESFDSPTASFTQYPRAGFARDIWGRELHL